MTDTIITVGALAARDLVTFLGRAIALEAASLARVRARADGRLEVWVSTGLEVLATRSAAGLLGPAPDTVVAAAQLRAALAEALAASPAPDAALVIYPGHPVDYAWHGTLPPETGYTRLDNLPGPQLYELASRGRELARDNGGPAGMPPSLLAQDVITVDTASGPVGIPMRSLFALIGMGFVDADYSDVVQVRQHGRWLRLDSRFGAVVRHDGPSIPLLVIRSG